MAPGRKQPVVFVGTIKVALSQAILDMLNSFRLLTMPATAASAKSSSILAGSTCWIDD